MVDFDAKIELFNDYLSDRIGIHYSTTRMGQLKNDMVKITSILGFASANACIDYILNIGLNDEELNKVATHLSIGETYFFRDRLQYKLIEDEILPNILRNKNANNLHMRILSVGCSSGEEPYSLAILIRKLSQTSLPQLKKLNIFIHGIDINTRFLEKARNAVYNNWSFRDVPQDIIKENFIQKGKEFHLNQEIKNMVSFSYVNILTDQFPSLSTNTTAFDLVLCKNVLIYFKPMTIQTILRKLESSMLHSGFLMVSGIEGSLVDKARMTTHHVKNQYYFRKKNTETFEIKSPVKNEFKTASNSVKRITSTTNSRAKNAEDTPKKKTENKEVLAHNTEVDPIVEIKQFSHIGKIKEAQQLCDVQIKNDRLNIHLQIMKALLLIEEGLLEEAITHLNKAIYLDGGFAFAYYLKGNIFLNIEKKNDAIKNYRICFDLVKQFPDDTIIEDADGLNAKMLRKILKLKLSMQSESNAY